jgi:hypothetical protein
MNSTDKLKTADAFGVGIGKNTGLGDSVKTDGTYTFTCTAPVESMRAKFVALRKRIDFIRNRNAFIQWLLMPLQVMFLMQLAKIPTYEKWTDTIDNLITTVGKNNMLDNHLAGSAYTAAWYMGLIDNASFTAVNIADTMASHAGWIESVAYSNATRIATAWSAASGGAKALSAALGFTINATATLNGGFINSVSTKSGTTGTLFSAGSFTGGTRAVISGDTVNASYTATLT